MDIEELHRVVVQGFSSVNGRFDSVEMRLDTLQVQVDVEFGRVKDALNEHGRQLKDIRSALDRKVDCDELEARH